MDPSWEMDRFTKMKNSRSDQLAGYPKSRDSDVEIPCHSIACSNAAMQAAKDEGRGLSGAQIPTGNIFRYL